MQTDPKHGDALSPEIQDVMKNLIAAFRVVKIYPSNNPMYSQAIKKSFESLSHFLETSSEYHVGVQKTYFTHLDTPLGKDAQVNRAIAQDLFAKGIREILFSIDITEDELQQLCQALALSTEELAMKSGISTILWEKGATHIKVTEAGLDEVITTKTEGGWDDQAAPDNPPEDQAKKAERKQRAFAGRTLVLGDAITDPEGFGASMIALAIKTRAEHESVEDRLLTLYRQASQKIQKDHMAESDALFDGLAKSILALDPPYREGFIAGKLYGELDAELAAEQGAAADQELPNALHEIQTGRFSNAWTIQQVTTLLKRTSSKKKAALPAPPKSPSELKSVPLAGDLEPIARELSEYSPEQMENLKTLSDAGMESDIIEAAVRTLILLIPLVKNPLRGGSPEKELAHFSGVVHQLEDILSYLLKNNNYELATHIIKTLNLPVDPAFKPRMAEALKKTATRAVIVSTIGDMRKHPKESPEYQAAYSYLSSLDRKATEALIVLLGEEKDKEARIFLLDLMKDFGKNQITMLGEYLGDERWYVVRNIVAIMGESKTDQALSFIRKVVDHKNVQVRQEVVKALVAIGGKKAAGLLAKYLRDPDAELQLTAVRAIAEFTGLGAEDVRPLIEFLEERKLARKEQGFTLELIKALGKIGTREAGQFLERYTRIRWWKPRKLQAELRAAALEAIEAIKRRKVDDGRTKRQPG